MLKLLNLSTRTTLTKKKHFLENCQFNPNSPTLAPPFRVLEHLDIPIWRRQTLDVDTLKVMSLSATHQDTITRYVPRIGKENAKELFDFVTFSRSARFTFTVSFPVEVRYRYTHTQPFRVFISFHLAERCCDDGFSLYLNWSNLRW